MAQQVKRPSLGFGSGRDLGVVGWGTASGSTLSSGSAWDSLSPLCPSPTCSLALSE